MKREKRKQQSKRDKLKAELLRDYQANKHDPEWIAHAVNELEKLQLEEATLQ